MQGKGLKKLNNIKLFQVLHKIICYWIDFPKNNPILP